MELLEPVQAVRRQLVSSGTVVAPHGERREIFPVAIGHGEGAALRDRVIDAGALRTFETGLGFAVSTLHICEGLLANGPGACHVAMDPFQSRAAPTAGTTYAGVGLRTLEEAGVASLVEFYEEESQTVLPRLLREGRIFDLAFIDGSHRFEAVFLDLVYAARLVPEGGVVFVDDTQLLPVRQGRCRPRVLSEGKAALRSGGASIAPIDQGMAAGIPYQRSAPHGQLPARSQRASGSDLQVRTNKEAARPPVGLQPYSKRD